MEWIRGNPKTAGALAALVGLVLAVLVWVLVAPSGGSEEPRTLGLPSPTASATPLKELPTAKPSTKPTSLDESFQAALGGGAQGSSMSMPGLQGGSLYKNLPRHRIDLRVSSEGPIGTVGYIVPTSLRHSSGIDKNVGTSWHLSTVAYGDPDYAQVFVQAGSRGFPIVCTIIVDGRVTERRATEGPYGQMMCQG